MKQSITGVGLPQNLRLRFWLHDVAIKEEKRFTVKQKALLEQFVRVMSEAQMPTLGGDNVFGVGNGIRSQHSGMG